MMRPRACAECGVEFVPKKTTQLGVYCSAACRNAARKVTLFPRRVGEAPASAGSRRMTDDEFWAAYRREVRLLEDAGKPVFVPVPGREVRPTQCGNCGAAVPPSKDGLCRTCYEYRRRTGRDRPYRVDGRKERTAVA